MKTTEDAYLAAWEAQIAAGKQAHLRMVVDDDMVKACRHCGETFVAVTANQENCPKHATVAIRSAQRHQRSKNRPQAKKLLKFK